jgi:cytochrome c oxidase subunit 3
MSESGFLHKQFDDLDQQRESASLGMSVFISSEVMFFGGLFLALAIYRYSSIQRFLAPPPGISMSWPAA